MHWATATIKKTPRCRSSRCSSPVFLDDKLGGCSDDDFEPIALMDEDHKGRGGNEDGEDEGDNVEEVAEGGAGDELSS